MAHTSEEGGGPPATEGSRLARYFTGLPGTSGGVTFTFDSPINAFSVDIIDALDGAVIEAFLRLSNSNGDSMDIASGGQPNNSVLFAGITDNAQAFSSVTIFSTKPQDAILLDRVQYNVVPIPPAAYLFASGLIGLIRVARYKST